jgi:4-amino-4-deoxy-L-arabinose transferase-like glycosyltransferase
VRPVLLEATALAGLLAIAAWIFVLPLHAATNYDEGNYLAALTDLRHGFTLGKNVYADQPPGWYALLQLLAWIFGNSVTAIRSGLILIALVGVVAAWACARRIGPWPAFFAAAVLVVAPPYPGQAAQIEADTPAAVLALAALACAVWADRGRGSHALAVLAGALIACAISVKLSALTAALPLAAIALWGRRLIGWWLLGLFSILAVEAFSYRHELGPIAHGAIGYHVTALGNGHWSTSRNVHELLHYLDWHTPFAWLFASAVVASIWLVLNRAREMRVLGAFWLFVPAGAAFVLVLKPLFPHHFATLAVAFTLPAGAALGLTVARTSRLAARGVALLAIVSVAAGAYQQHRWLVRLPAEPAWIFKPANWLRAETRPNEVVVTDIPIIAYYAHRRLVPDLVDSTFTRLDIGELTAAKVFAGVDRYHVRAAAIGRVFWADPQIRAAFNARFRHRSYGLNIVEYLGPRNR